MNALRCTYRRARRGAFRLSLTVALAACSAQSTGDPAVTPDKDASTDDAPPRVDGGNGTGAYGNCAGSPRRIDDDACVGALWCVPGYSAAGQAQFCTPRCDPAMQGADCPAAPPGTTARVVCTLRDPPATETYCSLSCQFDHDGCPPGMVCFGGFTCGWPR